MRNTFASMGIAIGQMEEKVPLPRYLEKGLQVVAQDGIDIDKKMLPVR